MILQFFYNVRGERESQLVDTDTDLGIGANPNADEIEKRLVEWAIEQSGLDCWWTNQTKGDQE